MSQVKQEIDDDAPLTLDEELAIIKQERFLNNFRGELPGGYRRSSYYLKSFMADPDSDLSKRRSNKMNMVDQVIKDLGFDPAVIAEELIVVERAYLTWNETNAQEDRNFLSEKEKSFFDKYEFPIYEALRRTYPYDDNHWTA